MTAVCEPARPADVNELKTLWKQSFDDTDQAIDLFFTRFFRPCDCVVYRDEGQVTAAAHMLPVAMADGARTLSCHYIYAAATRPAFRGQGRMGALLGYAADYGRKRGDIYSVLVPAQPSLFSYYQKQGYQPLSAIETVTMTKEDCLRRVREPVPALSGHEETDFDAMLRLRNQVLAARPGSLLWDKAALERAAALAAVYGGWVLQPDRSCYAYVRRLSEQTLEVTECITDGKGFDKIMVEMVKLPFKTCTLRLPVTHGLPGLRGTRSDFALCKPLDGRPVGQASLSYVGLPLD